MSVEVENKNLGHATAYAYAKAKGYQGTEEEFAQALADVSNVLEDLEGLRAEAETLPEGSEASVSYANGMLSFGIPKGDTGAKGNKGDKGDKGNTGATPNFSIGTVTTLEPNQSATAEITGTAEQPVLSLGIPKGAKGDPGDVANLADVYDSTKIYAVGDHCIKDGQYKVCIVPITTAEAWNSAHWADAEVSEEISDSRSALNAITDNVYELYLSEEWSASDVEKDGSYWFWRLPLKIGNIYQITNTTSYNYVVYLRAEKYTIPSLVSLQLTPNQSLVYIPTNNTEWVVVAIGEAALKIECKTSLVQQLYDNETTYVDIERNVGYYKSGNLTPTFESGNWGVNANTIVASTTRCYAEKVDIKGDKVHLEIPNTMKGRMNFFKANGAVIDTPSTRSWTTGAFDYTIPTDAVQVGISVAFTNDATILPSDCTNVVAFWFSGELPDDGQNAFEGKKISILGDSISTWAGDNPESAGDSSGHTLSDGTWTYEGNHCRYPNSAVTNVNDTYWKKLIDSLGMVYGENDSWAGSTVSWNGAEGADWGADIYIASPTRIGHLDDNGTPDIILVNAGTNDIGKNVTVGTFNTESPIDYTDEQIVALPVATFADAYRAMLIRLQKAYPLARIVVMLPNYTTTYYNPTKADQYLEIVKEACDYFGVPWVDMRTTGITMYNTGTYLSDGIHPNVAGMNMLYKKLKKFFVYSL